MKLLTILNEARLDQEFASYKVKKSKVIASLKGHKASVFTKYAKAYLTLDKKVDELAKKKVELNTLKNDIDSSKDKLHNNIRESISNVFDEAENTLTLTVECLGSQFTLNTKTEANEDKVVPAGKIENIDYKKAFELLYGIVSDDKGLITTLDDVIKKSTTIIETSEKIITGKKRGVRINVKNESILNEIDLLSIWNKGLKLFNKLTVKIKNLLTFNKQRLNKTNNLIGEL